MNRYTVFGPTDNILYEKTHSPQSIQRNHLLKSVSTLYSTARISSTGIPLRRRGIGILKEKYSKFDMAGEQHASGLTAYEPDLVRPYRVTVTKLFEAGDRIVD